MQNHNRIFQGSVAINEIDVICSRDLTAPENPTSLTVDSFSGFSVNLAEDAEAWYSFSAPVSASYCFGCSADQAPTIAVYNSQMQLLAAAVWESFGLTADETVYLYVAGPADTQLSLTVSRDDIAVGPDPELSNTYDSWDENTANLTVAPDSSAVLSVAVSGSLYLPSFTWYVGYNQEGNQPLEETTRQLTIPANSAGMYTCVVTDALGYSNEVYFHVTVINDIQCTLSGSGVTYRVEDTFSIYESVLSEGQSVTVKAEVSGTGNTNATYQWYETNPRGDSTKIIEGATSASYTVSFGAKGPDYLLCQITDSYGNQFKTRIHFIYNNTFSFGLSEDFDRTGWTVDEANGTAEILLPVGNNGVTMKVAAAGNDISAEYPAEYSWNVTDLNGDAIDHMTGLDLVQDQLVLEQVTQPLLCTVDARGHHGKSGSFTFIIRLDNELTAEAVLENGWNGYEYYDGLSRTDVYNALPLDSRQPSPLRIRVRTNLPELTVTAFDFTAGTQTPLHADEVQPEEGWEYYSLVFSDEVLTPVHGVIKVNDSSGNELPISYYAYVENNLQAEILQINGWTSVSETAVWTMTDDNTNPVQPLKIKVTADDMTGLTVTAADDSAEQEEPLQVTSDDTQGAGYYSISFGEEVAAGNTGYVIIQDQYGGSCRYNIRFKKENNLSVTLVDGDWPDNAVSDLLDYAGNAYGIRVDGVLPPGCESKTLRFIVQANDLSKITITGNDDYNGVIDPAWVIDVIDEGGGNPQTGTCSYTIPGPITEACHCTFKVDDGYGNTSTVVFDCRLENSLEVNAVVPDGWHLYSEPDAHYASVSGMLPVDNDGVTLQIEVSAGNKEGLTVQVYDIVQMDNYSYPEHLLYLDPDDDDESAAYWTYSYRIDGPIAGSVKRLFEVRDAYGNSYNVDFRISLDNEFHATASNGSNWSQILVAAGKTATLKLNVTGRDLSGLTIDWRRGDTDESIASAYNKKSYTTPKISKLTSFYAVVKDGYGNEAHVWFYVSVNNKLKISSTVGTGVTGTFYPTRVVKVKEGGSVTLKVTASATNTTGLKIYWYDSYPNGDVDPVAVISGKTASYTVRNIGHNQVYYALANDRYGNTAIMQFNIQVDNGLKATIAGTNRTYREMKAAPGDVVTLSVQAIANDIQDYELTYTWVESSDSEFAKYGSYEIIPDADAANYQLTVNGTRYYGCQVMDRFGNVAWVTFYVIANHLNVQPQYNRNTIALQPDETARLIAVVDESDWDRLEGVNNELAVIVNADDKEGLTWHWDYYGHGSYNSADVEDAEGKIAVTEPMTADTGYLEYVLTIEDAYNNYAECHIQIGLDNSFSAKAVNSSVTVASGKKATLKVSATAEDAKGISYQWFTGDNKLIKGATKASYTTPAIKKQTVFWCRVTDRYGNLAWVQFTVHVQNKLLVSANTPARQFMTVTDEGVTINGEPVENVTMSVKVTAKNSKNLRYAWYWQHDFDEGFMPVEEWITDGGKTLKIPVSPETAEAITGYYYCEVTDLYGNVDGTDFFVGIENGFSVSHIDAGNAENVTIKDITKDITLYRGGTGSLEVDVRIADKDDYDAGWYVLKTDNAGTFWQPLAGSDRTETQTEDGSWIIHESFTEQFNKEGTYTFCYEGFDKYGTNSWVYFTVKVITLKDVTAPKPVLNLVSKTDYQDEYSDGIVITFTNSIPYEYDNYENIVFDIWRKTGTGKAQNIETVDIWANTERDSLAWINEDSITVVDTSVTSNTKYTYYLIARDGEFTSKAGGSAAIKTGYMPAVMKSAVPLTNGVQVTWNKVSGAASYRLERRTDIDGEWMPVANKCTKTTYADRGAVSDEVNIYRVTPLNKKGAPLCPAQEESGTNKWASTYYLKAPVITAALGIEGVTISWAEVDAADTYIVERKSNAKGAVWTALPGDDEVTETADNVCCDATGNLTSGRTYSYRVTAVSDEGRSVASAAKSVTYYTAPTVKSVTKTTSGVKIIINNSVSSASFYRIWRSLDGGDWEPVAYKVKKATGKTTTYVDTTAGYLLTNAYRIQALNKSGVPISDVPIDDESLAPERYEVYNDVFLAAPKLLSVKLDFFGEEGGLYDYEDGVIIDWSGVEANCGVSYQVLRKTGKGSWTLLEETKEIDESCCKDTAGLKSGTTYSYTVRAVADDDTVSKNAAAKSIAFYNTPVIQSAELVEGSGVRMTWNAVIKDAKYKISWFNESTGKWQVLNKGVSGTSYLHKGCNGGNYRIQAYNKAGKAIGLCYEESIEFG